MKKLILFSVLYLFALRITSIYAQETELLPPTYSSEAVIVIEANTGMVLYANNSNELLYPASITKIMTALVVLEQIEDLSERIEFSDLAIALTPRTSSHIAMDVGETLTVYQALYGLMLSSANEVSLALAEHVAGNIEDFVDLMNRRAYALGAHSTFFVNPSGLPAEEQVTTAHDMALIMREAIRHPFFVNLISTRRFDIPPTERQTETRELLNTNRLIDPGPLFDERVIGSKTGWTTAAGHTLVTYAEQDGRRLIVSVLGGSGNSTFTDTSALLEYGFALPFEPTLVFETALHTPSVPIFENVNGVRTETGRLALAADSNIYFDLPPGFDVSQLRFVPSVPQAVAPPVAAGTALGSVSIYIGNYPLGTAILRVVNDIAVYAPIPQNTESSPLMQEPVTEIPYSSGYSYNYLAEAPFLFGEFLPALLIPLILSGVTFIAALIVHLAKRKKRTRKMLHARYARYPNYYRYR